MQSGTLVIDNAAPVTQADRLQALDALRGFAVLGILVMNITGFAMNSNAYWNPTVAGGSTGINLWLYSLCAVLVDGKMRGIFSMLFGAGVLLFTDRFEQKGLGMKGAEIYFRRLLWLGSFGIVHAFFLWWGEILYPYAIAGLLIFAFRGMSARGLLIFASVLIVIMTAFMTFDAFDTRKTRNEAMKLVAMQKAGTKLSDEQTEKVKKWEESWNGYRPDPKKMEKDRKAFSTNLVTAIPRRAELVRPWHNMATYSPKNWDVLAMMLLGMALLKNGFLSGACRTSTYVKVAVVGYLVGLPMAIWMAWNFWFWKFDQVAGGFSGALYEPSRIAICLAHVAVFLLIMRSGALQRAFSVLASTGQMAFTNYLMQSVICTTIFTGFHLYGKLERYQVLLIAMGIWAVQLAWSPVWLRHFRFGPMEWCWRSLTYWKRQPMRIKAPEPVTDTGTDIEAAPA